MRSILFFAGAWCWPNFREKYAHLRQADLMAAQIVEIVDKVREGKKVKVSDKDGARRGVRRYGGSVPLDDRSAQASLAKKNESRRNLRNRGSKLQIHFAFEPGVRRASGLFFWFRCEF
jgi:hypothetical protein